MELAATLKRNPNVNLLSTSGLESDSGITHLFGNTDSTSLCRWIPEVMHALALLRYPSRALTPLDTLDELVVYTHFDVISREAGLPATTSRDLLTSNDYDFDTFTLPPTPFRDLVLVTLRPFRPELYNAFPVKTIKGFATSLSMANAAVQKRVGVAEEDEGCAALAVEGYGKWKDRKDVTDLVSLSGLHFW